jgi:hypothetical protein
VVFRLNGDSDIQLRADVDFQRMRSSFYIGPGMRPSAKEKDNNIMSNEVCPSCATLWTEFAREKKCPQDNCPFKYRPEEKQPKGIKSYLERILLNWHA